MCYYASDKRCVDFSLKMHQKRLAAGLRPDPQGSLQRSPRQLGVGRREGEREKTGGSGGSMGNGGGDAGRPPPSRRDPPKPV